ncbi:MAG: hypothetical protein V1854_02545 [Methanobacteriota archaeon]
MEKEKLKMQNSVLTADLIFKIKRLIYDKDNFFKKILKDFEKNIHPWRAKKIEEGAWKIPGLAVI